MEKVRKDNKSMGRGGVRLVMGVAGEGGRERLIKEQEERKGEKEKRKERREEGKCAGGVRKEFGGAGEKIEVERC